MRQTVGSSSEKLNGETSEPILRKVSQLFDPFRFIAFPQQETGMVGTAPTKVFNLQGGLQRENHSRFSRVSRFLTY